LYKGEIPQELAFILPSAAQGRNQIVVSDDGRALSAFSSQRSACLLIAFVFSYFERQSFFAKRKEVIDKDSICSGKPYG
jgi:hypothetical protein